ncbi:MAG: CPBP family intramembrane metalloprotease [Sphingomonadales bacterium]|nr:CPBP family intramembrane metalloprotease [Sphingomonadales bacterium]
MIRVARFFRHPAMLTAAGFLLFMLAYMLTGIAASSAKVLRNTPVQLLIVLACAAGGVALYRWFERTVEKREGVEFALPGAGRELGAGLLLGFVLFSAMAGIVALLGGLEVDGVRGLGRLWSMASLAVASGLFEELIFRGILFRRIEQAGGSWAALAVTSAFFGLAHIMNPGATWFAAVAIAFEAGILLGAAFMLTRRLWLAVGIHAAWNFTQGWVFSVPVSGGKAPEGLLLVQRHGPEWLTGGAFGLEASAVAMGVATAAGCVMLGLAAKRGAFVAPMWKRAG